ncbi:amidohydrolase family protein [Gracilibacillus alcaliphilus]|uniref:amidohydrolase family protein n=1 Tax=Gracilibacillus alcaliphilus TaxID=1401441 RepID=UPI001957AC74|nr:amidohydrolase family protein [Gracilibacillus alcaliphilus]MBM7677180.1 L-fuconolactonase [Gracilibacillus alcaliphilus]
MRIDAHQHYWRIGRGDYGWITPEITELYRDYQEEDLLPHLKKHKIDQTITVQAAPTIAETEYLLKLSEESSTIAGVVGWVDLEEEDYRQQLDRLRQHPKFIGIRVMIQDMPDATIIETEPYLEAFAYLEKLDIPVDLLVRSDQLTSLIKVLDQVKLRGVIDHISKPNIAKGEQEPWINQMTTIASHPNIYCKISGMVTEAEHKNWETEQFRPYVQHIIDVFGANRVMYGSDWPVCLLSASYDEVYQLVVDTLPNELEKDGIFGGNACEFYKIGE